MVAPSADVVPGIDLQFCSFGTEQSLAVSNNTTVCRVGQKWGHFVLQLVTLLTHQICTKFGKLEVISFSTLKSQFV